ncbi:uncharacterized protein LOC129580481 [Sitodiplosis mosellana]|uniref:uncharacterized protein LOC129580481 n=1 Tax=Sitodiplosis mosellana TaxID=263140 RepID=UPI002444CB5D|nr:uncharacterized protein LOC129580481 [Sitodiplosis mosellana]
MQVSCIVLLFLLSVAMFGVKETVSIEEEETEVEFRTGSPQRAPQDKRFIIEPEGHLLMRDHEVEHGKNHVNDMETAETHHHRRRMRISRRFGFPPIGGFASFGGGGGGGFPFFNPLLGILGLFG